MLRRHRCRLRWLGLNRTVRSVAIPGRVVPGEWADSGGKIFLFRYSANRYSVLHSADDSQFGDSRQITASHRVLACRNASFHRTPDRIPPSRSRSRKISLANGGSWPISHCRNAIACRLSRLEWLRKSATCDHRVLGITDICQSDICHSDARSR